jgi:hypothetical protein
MSCRLLLAVALTALVGCSPTGPPPVADSEYYPLAVGLTWTYRGGEQPRTMRVARHEVVAGTPCALVETLQGQEVVATEHVFAKADGVYGLSRNGKQLSAPLPLFKLPPTPGTTWQVNFKIGGRAHEGTYSIGPAEEVTVPLGKLMAVPLQGEILEHGVRQLAFTYWFARGLGMVKQVMQLPTQTLVYELEKLDRPK